jgi:maltose O-acetyltransferase
MVHKDIYIYKKGSPKPAFSKMKWALLKLNQVPLVRNFSFIRKMVCRIYKIPFSATFGKNFYCNAPILILGKNVGLSNTYILGYAPVIIGDNSGFSLHNTVIASSHDYEDFSTVIAKPIIIEKNTWITSNVTILSGVTIGDNTVIGAGSIVTEDIPSGVFAAGNPCKPIREIKFTINT